MCANVGHAAPFAYIVDQLASGHQVRVFDTATGAETATIPLSFPNAFCDTVALHPNSARLYVGCIPGVAVIDTASNSLVKVIGLAGFADGMATNRAGTRLYVMKSGGRMAIIDTTNDTLLADYVPGGPAADARTYKVNVLPNNTKVYVHTSLTITELDAIDPNNAPSRRWDTLAPTGGAIVDVVPSADSSKLFAAVRTGSFSPGPGLLYSIDLATGAVSAPVNIPQQPALLTTNTAGTRLYTVHGQGSPQNLQPDGLTEIDAGNLAVIRSVNLSVIFATAVSVEGADANVLVAGDRRWPLSNPQPHALVKVSTSAMSVVATTGFGNSFNSVGSFSSDFLLPGCAGCCS